MTKVAPQLPFSMRSLEDKKQARMGVVECVTHGLLQPFPVVFEKEEGAAIAHFKHTVLVMKDGPERITGDALEENIKLDEDVKRESCLLFLLFLSTYHRVYPSLASNTLLSFYSSIRQTYLYVYLPFYASLFG